MISFSQWGEWKRRKNITQNDKKTKNETQEYDFKINEDDRNEQGYEQNKENTEIEKEKNAEPKSNKENHPNQREGKIKKNGEIILLESQSEDNEKNLT